LSVDLASLAEVHGVQLHREVGRREPSEEGLVGARHPEKNE